MTCGSGPGSTARPAALFLYESRFARATRLAALAVIVREAGESGERNQQSIEGIARVGARALGAPVVALQDGEGTPVLRG